MKVWIKDQLVECSESDPPNIYNWLVAEMGFGIDLVPPPMPLWMFIEVAKAWQRFEPDGSLTDWSIVLNAEGCRIKEDAS